MDGVVIDSNMSPVINKTIVTVLNLLLHIKTKVSALESSLSTTNNKVDELLTYKVATTVITNNLKPILMHSFFMTDADVTRVAKQSMVIILLFDSLVLICTAVSDEYFPTLLNFTTSIFFIRITTSGR